MSESLRVKYFVRQAQSNNDVIEKLPISLKVVILYSMLISKKYLNLNNFSLGDDSKEKKAEGGALVYYKEVSSILGKNRRAFDKTIMQGIEESNYNISLVNDILNGFEFISTSVIGSRYDKKHPTNHYIKGMKTTNGVGNEKISSRILSQKDVSNSTILLKKGVDVDYCLKELYSILPKEVVNALQDREAIKLVLGNQIEAKRPEIVANYQSIIGVKKPNTLIHKPNN